MIMRIGAARRSPRPIAGTSVPKIATVRAELTGSDTCTAAGITARGNAPALTLGRELLANGFDPDQAIEVYRSGTLALRIRSIGEADKLTVRESTRDGRPRFARLSSDGRPPVPNSEHALLEGWIDCHVAMDGDVP